MRRRGACEEVNMQLIGPMTANGTGGIEVRRALSDSVIFQRPEGPELENMVARRRRVGCRRKVWISNRISS